MEAVWYAEFGEAIRLLNEGADVQSVDRFGANAVLIILKNSSVNSIQYDLLHFFLEKGINPNHVDHEGNCLLSKLNVSGNGSFGDNRNLTDVFKLLVLYKVDLNANSDQFKTCIEKIISCQCYGNKTVTPDECWELVKYLIANGANLLQMLGSGHTVMQTLVTKSKETKKHEIKRKFVLNKMIFLCFRYTRIQTNVQEEIEEAHYNGVDNKVVTIVETLENLFQQGYCPWDKVADFLILVAAMKRFHLYDSRKEVKSKWFNSNMNRWKLAKHMVQNLILHNKSQVQHIASFI